MFMEKEPYYRFIQLVAGIHLNTRQFTERRLKDLGVTYPQFGALIILSQKDGITQKELAELLQVDTTTVMVICDSLEKRDWLVRSRDTSDRRVNRLLLTGRGRNIYAQAVKLIQTGYEYVLAKTSPDELNGVIPFLEQAYQRIQEASCKETK